MKFNKGYDPRGQSGIGHKLVRKGIVFELLLTVREFADAQLGQRVGHDRIQTVTEGAQSGGQPSRPVSTRSVARQQRSGLFYVRRFPHRSARTPGAQAVLLP